MPTLKHHRLMLFLHDVLPVDYALALSIIGVTLVLLFGSIVDSGFEIIL